MNIDKTLDPKLPSYLNEDYFAETGCLHNGHHIVIDDSYHQQSTCLEEFL